MLSFSILVNLRLSQASDHTALDVDCPAFPTTTQHLMPTAQQWFPTTQRLMLIAQQWFSPATEKVPLMIE